MQILPVQLWACHILFSGFIFLRCSETFKIVEICFLLGCRYHASSVLLFFSVYFCNVPKISLYFRVVMCEVLYLYVLSKCSTTECKVLRDYILYGECLWTLSMKKNGKRMILATQTLFLLASDLRINLPSRLPKNPTASQCHH